MEHSKSNFDVFLDGMYKYPVEYQFVVFVSIRVRRNQYHVEVQYLLLTTLYAL